VKTLPFLFLAFVSLAQAEPPSSSQESASSAGPATSPEPTATPAAQPSPTASPAVQVSAETPTTATQSSKFDQGLLGGTDPLLTEQERAGVAITQAWRDKSYETMVGQPGANSSVEFRFGQSLPSIVCAILQVTDIELQAGEVVTQINLGDTTRWTVESAVSGSGADQVQHLIVKPRDIGLSTSLVVTTDRRTYHLLLVSDRREFMHDVTFLYDRTPSATPPVVASATPAPSPAASDPPAPRRGDGKQVRLVSRDEADNADESYTVAGNADWKPVEVYSKDGKTYLEMPASVRHKEAPVLFEEKKAGWFHHDKALVNYRVHGRWYVVDRVLDNATLVSGVGGGQEKVDIRHVNAPNPKPKTAEMAVSEK
jgi:type IV secretion system protein VirB9